MKDLKTFVCVQFKGGNGKASEVVMKLMTQAPTPGLKPMQEMGLKAAWAKITGV